MANIRVIIIIETRTSHTDVSICSSNTRTFAVFADANYSYFQRLGDKADQGMPFPNLSFLFSLLFSFLSILSIPVSFPHLLSPSSPKARRSGLSTVSSPSGGVRGRAVAAKAHLVYFETRKCSHANDCFVCRPKYPSESRKPSVSYTHLTLPTKRIV